MIFFFIKPDAMERGLSGEILNRIIQNGFSIVATKTVPATLPQMLEHYGEYKEEEWFQAMILEYSRGTILAGLADIQRMKPEEVIKKFREMIGPRDNPQPGTIRGDFALNKRQNCIHASDSSSTTLRESRIWLR